MPAAPISTFEKLDPSDLLTAISSFPKLPCFHLVHKEVGIGYNTLLNWALSDLQSAEAASSGDDRLRFCVNSLMNARRALSCLADQYLLREAICFCKDAPKEPKKISEALIARGIFTPRASQCLEKAVAARNRIEHQYESTTLEKTQELVHSVHMTVEFTVKKSPPFHAPILIGYNEGARGVDGNVISATFRGWGSCCFIMLPFATRPWLGVVESKDGFNSNVRRAYLDEFKLAELLPVLDLINDENRFRRVRNLVSTDRLDSANLWQAQFEKAGIAIG